MYLLFSFQTKEVANSVFDEKMIACDQYSMEIPYIETKLTSDEGTELLFCQGVSINNFWKHLAKTSDFPLTNHCVPSQNGIWVKFQRFQPTNGGEKWSGKNIVEIPQCAHHVIFITDFSKQNTFLTCCRRLLYNKYLR